MLTLTRLLQVVQAAAPGVADVSVGQRGDSSTVRVSPANQQVVAQSAIDSFDWSAAAEQAWVDAQAPERTTLRQAAAQAVVDIDTYLAIASPTNAQVAAQVRRLSVDMRAVIKRLTQLD